MAFRSEKNGEDIDIVIDGFETGIAPSPHKGIANIQNGNISTELGEVTASFVRQQQSMTETAATGTLAYFSTDHVTLDIPGSNDLFKGNWITVTNSSHTGELPNGTYYVPPSTGANFQLANYYQVSDTETTSGSFDILVVAGGGGGGGASGNTTNAGGGGAGGVSYNAGYTVTSQGYAVSVGAGGTGGAGGSTGAVGTNGNNSSFDSISTTGGGGGGGVKTSGTGNATGANGGSGGGGGRDNSNPAPGGTGVSGQGHNGGTSPTSQPGSGGGGSSAVGTASAANVAGNGGNGTANSITGSSVTYGGGGGGGDGISGGTGGTGGGGAGGSSSVRNGSAGTANTGGGGGGAGSVGSGAAGSGGDGGSGIVIISATIGVVTNPTTAAVGGTHTTSGGNDIWTFTNTAGGTFYPTFASVPAPTNILTGFTTGLTATIQLTATMGKPLAKATESYFRSGTQYNRYYILDNQNLVWVYDTYNETLYSSSDNVSWFLPDYKTNWCTSASGIGVIDGFLIATAQSGTYAKETAMLGGINTQNSNWTEFSNDIQWNGGATTAPHFCYVGHQGYLYITDGNYIRSIFPDATLASASVASTKDNVQSFASWTVDGGAATPTKGIPSPISGGMPITSDNLPLPVVFTTTGTLPRAISANTVYYLLVNSSGEFTVFPDPTMATSISEPVMTGELLAGVTTATLTANWAYPTGIYYTGFAYSGGTEYHNVLFTNGSTAIIWGTALANNTTSTTLTVVGFDLSAGAAGTQYYNTFYPLSSNSDYLNSTTPTFVLSTQRLALPNFEVAQTMAEIGNTVIIGCLGNVVYPWDQESNLPGTIISLPESNVQWILTVNQIAYLAAGNQGNIYLTDGSLASLVINMPDYAAGVPGSPGTYIESTYTWTDAMYLRGRIYFGIIDQNSSKAGNCGGIWSFVPTQNLYLGQDTGIALRLESQNSYNTYNGAALLLLGRVNQNAQEPLYWSAWESDVTSPTYGIDYSTGGTSASFPFVVETDALPVGTMLNKKTFSQVEYKLSSPLDAGATVQIYARSDLTGAWTSMGTVNTETSALSGYFPINFQTNQWLQLRIVLTPITSSASTNSFVRLKEIRIR